MDSEEEAQGKWCPMVRLAGFADSQAAGTSWNRLPGDTEERPSSTCIASRCMMWRWGGARANDPSKVTSPTLPLLQVALMPESEKTRVGYCGLAANPNLVK